MVEYKQDRKNAQKGDTTMNKQLNGIALVLFGILLCCAEDKLNHTVFKDFFLPFAIIGVIIGVIGLFLVFWPEKKHRK